MASPRFLQNLVTKFAVDWLADSPDPPELPECLQRRLSSPSELHKAPPMKQFFKTYEIGLNKNPSEVHVLFCSSRKGKQTGGREGIKENRTAKSEENTDRISFETSEIGKHTIQPERVNTVEHGKTKRKYECSLCKFQRITRAAVLSHINRAHFQKTHKCTECAYQTTNPDCLNQHVKYCGSYLLRCSRKNCDYTTRREHDLKRHAVTHNKRKHWLCDDCGNGFKLKQGLKLHQSGYCRLRKEKIKSVSDYWPHVHERRFTSKFFCTIWGSLLLFVVVLSKTDK